MNEDINKYKDELIDDPESTDEILDEFSNDNSLQIIGEMDIILNTKFNKFNELLNLKTPVVQSMEIKSIGLFVDELRILNQFITHLEQETAYKRYRNNFKTTYTNE
mgnify:CR=1 FL=1